MAPTEPATNALPAAKRPDDDVPAGRAGARKAQTLYAMSRYAEAAAAYLAAAQGAAGKSQRDFKYNAALAFYKAGQYADASRVLKELELSTPEIDPAASSALGAAYYRDAGRRLGNDSTNLIEKARLTREAADAFRRAARAESDNADSRHNLALALEQLPELEEQAKIARLLAQYGNTPAPRIAASLLTEQRQVVEGAAQAFTNASPNQIKTLESLAEKQKTAADLWIPLKGKLLQALQQQGGGATNQNQMAQLNQVIEATRDSMLGAASKLRDLEPESLDAASRAEAATYGMWKGIAPFDLILQEDLLVQTNALARTASKLAAKHEPPLPPRPEQEEALNLTRLFANRFEQSVLESGLSAAPVPGPPPPGPQASQPDSRVTPSTNQLITAETRKKILELAVEAATVQEKAAGLLKAGDRAGALTEQTRAYELLKEIEKLLPKNRQQQQPQEQPQNPDQQTQQQKPEEEQKQQPKEQKEEPKDQTPEDVKRLLEKALQREQEHEAEKRREREREYPMSPREKDW
ncbi:MAG: hypothetical protein QME60_04285 [Verrucomicrobiota bacterium]|nr:hypothetical protein [Verrucomicrobiota bacterium]